MNVGLIQLPKTAWSNLQNQQVSDRQEQVSCLLDQEDRYCGEVLTS